jgi:hypothetical protein
MALIIRFHRIRVNQIDRASWRSVDEQAALPLSVLGTMQSAPADVGYLQRNAVGGDLRNRPRPARNQVQALVLAELFARCDQHLHSQANAQ